MAFGPVPWKGLKDTSEGSNSEFLADCVTLTVLPNTVRLPVRCAPVVFAATATFKVPPVPGVAEGVSQETLAVAAQPHVVLLRVRFNEPAVPGTTSDCGETVIGTVQVKSVTSVAVAVAAPPPKTVAELVKDDDALGPTFTVKVMGG